MLAPSLSKLATLGGGDFEAFDLPFLFRDHAAFRAVAQGPVGAAILRKLEARGIKGLAYWDNGFKVFTADRALHRVGDFAGLRIRVQASRVSTAQVRALGAEPRVTPLSDVYNDLKQGLLDGEEGVASNIYTQHLHDVQKHLTISNHGYLAYAVIVNKGFWEGLPSDLRDTLENALKDATLYANGLAEAENAQALERIRASGKVVVYTLSDAERLQWRAAMAGVYQDASAWIQPQTIAAIRAAAGPGP
jgi:C4-dicarboxylate-binding protein DctP